MFSIRILFFIFLFIPLTVNAGRDSASTESDSEESVYTLMTLPSVKKSRAEATLERLKATMPDAKLRKVVKETVIYRLEVKCFDDIKSAKLLKDRISKVCKSPFIVPADNSYCVIAGSQINYNSAVEDQKYFARKNINTSIVKSKVSLPQWQITAGNFKLLKDSVYMATAMSTKGLTATIQPVDKKCVNKSKETLLRLMSEDIASSFK